MLQQALAGKVGNRLASLLALRKFSIAPVFDPLGLQNEEVAVHTRCSALRRALYCAAGLQEVLETVCGGVHSMFEMKASEVYVRRSEANPWSFIELDQQPAESISSAVMIEVRGDLLLARIAHIVTDRC